MLSLFISLFIIFGSPEKGYKELTDGNYAKAIDLLKQTDGSAYENTISSFGLAIIYSSTNSGLTYYDTAYVYICKSENYFKQLNTKEKEKLNKSIGITTAKIASLKKNIPIEALKLIADTDVENLEAFAKFYKDEPIADKVKLQIEEMQYFAGAIKDTNDPAVYQRIIKLFPKNARINEVWLKFYKLSTYDGKSISYYSFDRQFPEFPLDSLLKQEWDIASICDNYRLLEGKTQRNAAKCHLYITQAAPKIQAFEVLQVYLKEYIDKKEWQEALKIALTFKSFFEGNKLYSTFLKLLDSDCEISKPEKLPSTVNSIEGHEYSPVPSANGSKLYFAGFQRKDNLGGEDIFVSEYKSNAWQQAELLTNINTPLGNEAPEAIAVDESLIILYFNGDIYQSERTGNTWSQPMSLKAINTKKWEGDAVLSADGNALIFASSAWEKLGFQYENRYPQDEFDLYVSVKQANNTWSKPQNLGLTVNTPYCDRYPFLHPDMKTLYYSSHGHGSLGYSDVYKTVRLSDTSWTEWSEPENIGKYINTSGDDNGFKIATDGSKAYFSVNKGNIDIYSIQLPQSSKPDAVAMIQGRVTDAKNQVVEVLIEVEDLETGKKLFSLKNSSIDGSYTMILPKGKKYGYTFMSDKYLPSSDNFYLSDTSQAVTLEKNYRLYTISELVESGNAFVVNNLFFDTDKSLIKKESETELKRLIEILKKNKITKIKILGHTDAVGAEDYNLELSQKRAIAVKEFIANHELSSLAITTQGFGSTRPVATNTSEQGRASNRRVEIIFEK
ncbi:MAG: OmpA family protein [Bacteroidales bacterium]|nr:OmpA family protein [Bacteroidales bacterium]